MDKYVVVASSAPRDGGKNAATHEMWVWAPDKEAAEQFFRDKLEEEGYKDVQELAVVGPTAYMSSWSIVGSTQGRRTDTWAFHAQDPTKESNP